MSGTTRKSAYRKHLTDKILNEFPEPDPNAQEYIARISASRGGNLLEISVDKSIGEGKSDECELAILPSKFHKLVWVKRGDFVIVQGGNDDSDTNSNNTNKVRYMVKHILYKEQVKFLRSKPYWPEKFRDEKQEQLENDGALKNFENVNCEKEQHQTSEYFDDIDNRRIVMNNYEYASDGEEDEYAADSDLFINTNRVAKLRIDDSDESTSDEE